MGRIKKHNLLAVKLANLNVQSPMFSRNFVDTVTKHGATYDKEPLYQDIYEKLCKSHVAYYYLILSDCVLGSPNPRHLEMIFATRFMSMKSIRFNETDNPFKFKYEIVFKDDFESVCAQEIYDTYKQDPGFLERFGRCYGCRRIFIAGRKGARFCSNNCNSLNRYYDSKNDE